MHYYFLDVARPQPPLRDHLPFGDDRISVTSRWVERDGRPFIPVGGELHYSRVPREQWAASLERMRAGGVTVVTTYCIWNHHEQPDGSLSFEGRLDLRAFVELATQKGLDTIVRLGPYAHAEVRHGGLPDRLLEEGIRVRSDDPRYLAEVEPWFEALARQLDGVALFGIQVENELYDDPDHLLTLKRIAQSHGLRAPLWTGTAWGGAHLPPDELLPLFAGYSDAFWIPADATHDPASAKNFSYSDDRDEVNVGADTRDSALTPSNLDLSRYPYATCELGGGMAGAYHRRPHAAALDVAALALTKIGSGSVWQGYYMFHDGRNPRPGLQESHATGARNDFPELDYDFGAPLAIDGALRESWFRLRQQHGMLSAFGASLATMPATFPDEGGQGGLRWAVRSDGVRGWVFVTNREPYADMPAHPGVTLEVRTQDGAVTFPAVDIPSGVAFTWPFRLEVGAGQLRTATAQPFALVEHRGAPLLALAAIPGIPALLDWGADEIRAIEPPPGGPSGSWGEVVRDGVVIARWVVLDEADALLTTAVGGALWWGDGVVTASTAVARRGDLRRLDAAGWLLVDAADDDREPVRILERARAGLPPEPRTGGSYQRASAPTDWSSAAQFDLELPPVHDRSLVLDWEGDAARLLDGDRLVADAFFNGREWRIGAPDLGGATRLRLEVLAPHRDAAVGVGAGSPSAVVVRSAWLERP